MLATLKYSCMRMFETASGSVDGIFSPINQQLTQKQFVPMSKSGKTPEDCNKEVLACRNTNTNSGYSQAITKEQPKPKKQLRIDSFVPVEKQLEKVETDILPIQASRDRDTPAKRQREQRDSLSPLLSESKSSTPLSGSSAENFLNKSHNKRSRSVSPNISSEEKSRAKKPRCVTPIPLNLAEILPTERESSQRKSVSRLSLSRESSPSEIEPMEQIILKPMAKVVREISGDFHHLFKLHNGEMSYQRKNIYADLI